MDITTLLPLVLQLLSRGGGDVSSIMKLVTELLVRIQTLLPPVAALPDITTVRGLQDALRSLGFDPGPTDGDYGAKTKAAAMAFQHWWNGNHPDARLVEDGWIGVKSSVALAQALREKM